MFFLSDFIHTLHHSNLPCCPPFLLSCLFLLFLLIPSCSESGDLHLATSEDDILTAEVDERRPVVKAESPESPEMAEKRKEAYFDLIHDLDMLVDGEAQQNGDEGIETFLCIVWISLMN